MEWGRDFGSEREREGYVLFYTSHHGQYCVCGIRRDAVTRGATIALRNIVCDWRRTRPCAGEMSLCGGRKTVWLRCFCGIREELHWAEIPEEEEECEAGGDDGRHTMSIVSHPRQTR